MAVRVIIRDKAYLECQEAAQKMWCSSKPGIYGKGLLNTKIDKFKTERLGRLGEMALSIYTGKPVDFLYKKFGDSGDLLDTKVVDIKTASRNYGKILIQAITEYGYPIKLKSDYYIGAYCEYDSLQEKVAKIILMGWIKKECIAERSAVPAIKGLHMNYEVRYNELSSIETFKEELDGKAKN